MLFDHVHGHGWKLLSLEPIEHLLSQTSRDFFGRLLGGKCVRISTAEDVSGEYSQWFSNDMGPDHVALIRPDFYVFGHAPAPEVNDLVLALRAKLNGIQ